MMIWVIGSNGLLGASLVRTLRAQKKMIYTPAQNFSWADENALQREFIAAIEEFSIRVKDADGWQIYWAAGIGSMSSNEEELQRETKALSFFMQQLKATKHLVAKQGVVAFASSAGAIYAGSKEYIIDENSVPVPTTAYGREKLKQENIIHALTVADANISTLLARISTLYGPGQALGKKQGLVAHIARCILKNSPIQIYVPFDTIRDYIAVDDAAAAIIKNVQLLSGMKKSLTKIIASEQATTIAEIIGTFKRIARRSPKLVTSLGEATKIYSRRVQFKSIQGVSLLPTEKTTLAIGIANVMASERVALTRNLDPKKRLNQ